MTQRRFISGGSPWEELAGYARAVVDGDWIFVSGTVGAELDGGFAPAAHAQCQRALDIVEAALAQAEASLDDVVRVRAYVPERAEVVAVCEALKARLANNRPANTTLCCPLAVEGARVELEVTALRRSRHFPITPETP